MRARSILRIEDLSDADIRMILSRADEFRRGVAVDRPEGGRVAGTIFLEPSLRTRAGFTAAAARLGWGTVDVHERRHSPTSAMESWADTLRTIAGYCDAVIVRPGQPLGPQDVEIAGQCALVNGGDVGSAAEHPSQALIDLFAVETLIGSMEGVRLTIVGDPRMRAVRSLMRLLARRPPRVLGLIADAEHLMEVPVPEGLRQRTEIRSWDDVGDMDVIYVAGIPHNALPLERRDSLLATEQRVNALRDGCILLSPMPVIDEMDSFTRKCGRNRMYEQSDMALFVRMAILEWVVGDSD